MRYAFRMTTVAVRLPDDMVETVDELVKSGRYATRTQVIRLALAALLDANERRAIDRRIIDGYTRNPQTDEESAIATAATRALIEDEPW